jgi:hypothetical protein
MSDKSRTEHGAPLGDESFMSAADLRAYMTDMQMAHVGSELVAMDKATKARQELVKTLSEPLELTPDVLQGVTRRVMSSIKSAAGRGETEIMVMRFPNELCSDKGRAINNSEEGWPDTLTGRPRQAYELWRDRLRENDYKLKAMIIDWPGGLPGDIGLFLSWKTHQS